MKKFTLFALIMVVMIILVPNIMGFAQTPFTPGNLLVLRAGDGAASLSTVSTMLFLDEFTPAGTLVQTVVIPTTGTNQLTSVGNATTEGHMTLSPDGYFLLIPGYDAGPGVASIGGTSAATYNRKLLRVDYQANFYPILSGTAFSGTNIRSAVCSGDNYWASGSSGGTAGTNGVQYFGNGTPGQISSNITNIKDLNIFNNQIYFSSTIGTFGIYAVGTGLPTTGPQVATNVINTGSGLPCAFSFNSTGDICYIADERTTGLGGIQKWFYLGGFWTLSHTISVGATTGVKGLTVDWSGPNPVIYATTNTLPASTPNKLIRVEDVGATSPFTIVSAAFSNTQYRSVMFAPVAQPLAPPTIQAHDLSFTGVSTSGMTAHWLNGNGEKRIVIINTINNFTNPANGSNPAANAAYTGPGEQVVFNGSGDSVSVTGLASNTTYWFRVYEFNGTLGTSKFLLTTATLNPNSQTTIAEIVVPLTQVVQNVTLGNGQSNCYNATDTISVAGSGTIFLVQSGGSATMIAGQNILYYPGTTVENGGYMLGSIAPGGPYCGGVIPAAPVLIAGKEEITGSSASPLKIYPNPTSGIFTLEPGMDLTSGTATVEIFSIHGKKVFQTTMTGVKKQSFSLSGLPAGIYCVRIVSGDISESARLILQ